MAIPTLTERNISLRQNARNTFTCAREPLGQSESVSEREEMKEEI